MSPRYLRRRPDRSENARSAIMAAGFAASVGVIVFYFTRLLIAREPLATLGDEREGAPPGSGE